MPENERRCSGYDWCVKYADDPKELNCADCDHFTPFIDDIMMRYEK